MYTFAVASVYDTLHVLQSRSKLSVASRRERREAFATQRYREPAGNADKTNFLSAFIPSERFTK